MQFSRLFSTIFFKKKSIAAVDVDDVGASGHTSACRTSARRNSSLARRSCHDPTLISSLQRYAVSKTGLSKTRSPCTGNFFVFIRADAQFAQPSFGPPPCSLILYNATMHVCYIHSSTRTAHYMTNCKMTPLLSLHTLKQTIPFSVPLTLKHITNQQPPLPRVRRTHRPLLICL